jgi:DNA-binding MarR family transcriptional regulator
MPRKTPNKRSFKNKLLMDDYTGDLYVLFAQVHDTIEIAQEMELELHGINFAQGRVMYALLKENRPMTQTEISEWILRKFNTVSTLVAKLIKKGYLKRIKSKKNGKTYIAITDNGYKLWEGISQRALYMIFSELSQQEKEQLYSSLKKLRKVARGLLGWDYSPPFLP